MDSQFSSFISVPQNKIPVITYDNIAGSIRKVIADAINLLRSGHPAVQIIVEYPNRLGIEDRNSLWDKFSEVTQSLSIVKDQHIPGIETEIYATRYSDRDVSVLGIGGNFVVTIYKF